MPRFFISYVYEDKAYKEQIRDWWKKGELDDWSPLHETEDLRPSGSRAVRRHLSPLIQRSSALVLLVGDNNHNHEWIRYEVDHAMSSRIPVILLRLPNTRGAPPLSVRNQTEIPFSPFSLLYALDTCGA